MNKYAGMVLVCSLAMGGAQAGELGAKASPPEAGVLHTAAPTLKLMSRASGIRVKSVILRDARARSEKPVKPDSPTAMSEGGLCMPESNQVCPVPEDDPWLQINWYFDYFNDAMSRWEVAEVRQELKRVEVTATKPNCNFTVVGPWASMDSTDCNVISDVQGMDGQDKEALLAAAHQITEAAGVLFPDYRLPKKLDICAMASGTFASDAQYLQATRAIESAAGDNWRNGDTAEVRYSDGAVYTFRISRLGNGRLLAENPTAGGGSSPKC
ncbi:MAG: hypothetical protein J0M20_16365 [Burkholderiales bacterium]|nr:hypothetical protein [Burkholderiales bacterium]